MLIRPCLPNTVSFADRGVLQSAPSPLTSGLLEPSAVRGNECTLLNRSVFLGEHHTDPGTTLLDYSSRARIRLPPNSCVWKLRAARAHKGPAYDSVISGRIADQAINLLR